MLLPAGTAHTDSIALRPTISTISLAQQRPGGHFLLASSFARNWHRPRSEALARASLVQRVRGSHMRGGTKHPAAVKTPGGGISRSRRRNRKETKSSQAAEEAERVRRALVAEAEARAAQLAAAITTTFVKPSLPPAALDWRLATSKAWNLAWSSKPQFFPRGLPPLPLVLPVSRCRSCCPSSRLGRPSSAPSSALASETAGFAAASNSSSTDPVAAVAAPSAAGALDPSAAGSGQLAAAVPDSRDEKIAALSFQLKELAKRSVAAFKRSVATAAAFVHNPANDLLSAPGRETSVSPLPADPHPAAPPSPPPARPPIKLRWNTGPPPGASVVAGLARRQALPLPP